MKTELQIAKENVKLWKEVENPENLATIVSHKETCQRFLEFLKENEYRDDDWHEKVIYDKIQDLKEAIKHYEENGI